MREMLRTLRRLNSAEELLSYFRIPHERRVLNIHRIGMLQRAHALLSEQGDPDEDDDALYRRLRQLLLAAYTEFEQRGDAPERPAVPPPAPSVAFVPLDAVRGIAMTRPAAPLPSPNRSDES